MTITLQWWYLPALLAVLAFVVPCFIKTKGDYDFGTPMMQVGIFGVLMAAAIGIVVGHLFG